MTKLFFKFKKPYFWSFLIHFPNFWSKQSCSKKSSCHAQLLKVFWNHAKIQRNLMIQFQENTQTGDKDGQNLFHRILPATSRGLTSKTAVHWHLKVKDIEYNVSLTKNNCITVTIQKIGSIHKLIQQILGSHELNGHAQFWPHPPKNHWNYF